MQLDQAVICQFRFICTERWDSLTPITGDSGRRFCTVCKTPVHLTNTYQELQANIAAKRCVAIFLENADGPSSEFMGYVTPAPLRPKDETDPFLTRSIDYLELSEETSDVLKISNFQLVGDLIVRSKSELVELLGITESQVNEILEVLACYGLTIGTKLDNWELLSAKYR